MHDSHGDTVLYTDSHGDGQADVATEITPDGQVVIADHTADHQWTEVQHGHLDANGKYVDDGTGGTPFTPPVDAPQQPVRDVADDRALERLGRCVQRDRQRAGRGPDRRDHRAVDPPELSVTITVR